MSQHVSFTDASFRFTSSSDDIVLDDPIEPFVIMAALTGQISTESPSGTYEPDTCDADIQMLQMEFERQLRINTQLSARVAEVNAVIATNAKCRVCRRVMANPYWLSYCEHSICYKCLTRAFIDELRRRALICDRILRRLCCIDENSPPHDIAHLARAVERFSPRLSYPCPICSIRTSEPPIPARALGGMIGPLVSSESDSEYISTDQGTFDIFFPSCRR